MHDVACKALDGAEDARSDVVVTPVGPRGDAFDQHPVVWLRRVLPSRAVRREDCHVYVQFHESPTDLEHVSFDTSCVRKEPWSYDQQTQTVKSFKMSGRVGWKKRGS